MPTLQTIQITPVSYRLHQPFITAKGKKSETHNVLVTVILSNGVKGIGEASSSIAMPGETQANMHQALRSLVPEIRERDIEDYREIIQTCWRKQPYHPTAVGALECALLDAYTRVKGKALYQFFGGKKTAVETDLTLS